jgi:uncharacterized protein (DUF983 family)
MLFLAIRRGARGRCPQCGRGRIFDGYGQLAPACSECGLALARREGDLFAFMYASTGLVTAAFLIGMWFVKPANLALGQAVVLVGAVAIMLATWPARKGIAVAIDYVRELKWSNHEGLAMRPDDDGDPSGPTAASGPRSPPAPRPRPSA